jgi:ubiquitin-protein ligase E3 C
MFQTFTGSSRRPRQVNLSGGRKSDGNALLLAQQERERRQRDRDRQNTARLLQRLWRGHNTRKQIRQRWRDEWDEREQQDDDHAYGSQEEALGQLQRLLHFVRLQEEQDVDRLRRYAKRLRRTLQNEDIICAGGPWPMAYLRLRKLVLTAIPTSGDNMLFELETVAFVGEQIPEHSAQSASQIYQTMAGVVHRNCVENTLDNSTMGLVTRIITAPLLPKTAGPAQTYEAFACDFLTLPDITELPFYPKWLDSIAQHVDYKLLASALASAISSDRHTTHPRMRNSRNRLNLLACFIYFHRFAHKFQNAQAYSSHKDFVHVISVLLSSVADHIDLGDSQSEKSFAQEQIISLVNQESIGSLLWGASNSPARPGSPPHMNRKAKQLANYALTLLRFFPRRGDEIRMWLYLGSTSTASASLIDSDRTPAIKFFWQAARSCMVFNNISRDSRSVIRLLKPQPDWEGQTTNKEHTEWVQDDWRVILVFLELYTFVLKLMDDEEFFSVSSVTSSNQDSSWARYNALPLDDIKQLTIFLKNLGFTMYFHAKEIVEEHVSLEETVSLRGYFQVAAPDRAELDLPSLPKTPESAIAGLPGISSYLANITSNN